MCKLYLKTILYLSPNKNYFIKQLRDNITAEIPMFFHEINDYSIN